MGRTCGTYGGDVHTELKWVNLRERDHLKDSGVDGRIVLKSIFERLDEEAHTGSIWLRVGTGGGLL
jgi:hypothetical protein